MTNPVALRREMCPRCGDNIWMMGDHGECTRCGFKASDAWLAAVKAAQVIAKPSFGFRLLRRIATGQPSSNVLISPVSLAAALAMTYNGAAGETCASDCRCTYAGW